MALALIGLSVMLMAGRHYVLGSEIDGTPGSGTWNVRLVVEGRLTGADVSIITVLPPDFRRQHIIDESFDGAGLSHAIRTARDGGQRRAVWRGRAGGPQRFRLSYSFRCVTGMHRPTPGMVQRTHALDAPPTPDGRDFRQAPLIESDHADVTVLATRLVSGDEEPAARARALFDYVAALPPGGAAGALDCLHDESGSDAGKSRLLVALCRNRHIAARPVCGLVLAEGTPPLYHWAEAWVENHWLPMDPVGGHFGTSRLPENYLVLQLGDQPVRGDGVRFQAGYAVADLHDSLAPQGAPAPSLAKRVWRKLSLGNLRPEEQGWVKFLLLLPVAALVVSIFRTIIGINTYGTFGPALLGLVCRDVRDFPWALALFVGIMLAGWCLRRGLDRFHLLLVPRISVLLTCIVILLVVSLMLLGPYAGTTHGYAALLPLIILTHMVERFWTVETEDSTAAAFRTLLGTVIVAIAVAVIVNFDLPLNGIAHLLHHSPLVPHDVMRTTLFRYPEALGLVLAAQFLIGRYTGYRMSELFRFRDLLLEEFPSGDNHGSTGSRSAIADDGRPGDESAQHGVHPGPQSEAALPPGGRQKADARHVSGDGGADS
jgi:hypothetical protein